MPPEFGERRCDRQAALLRRHVGDALSHADGIRQIFVETSLHTRFVVEGLHLAGTAGHEEIDDPLGAWLRVS